MRKRPSFNDQPQWDGLSFSKYWNYFGHSMAAWPTVGEKVYAPTQAVKRVCNLLWSFDTRRLSGGEEK